MSHTGGMLRLQVQGVQLNDDSVLKRKIKPGTVKRTLALAIPYASHLGLLLFVVMLAAGVGMINPLIYRQIINKGILLGNSAFTVQLAVAAGVLGILEAVLGLAQVYVSARIGARLVLDLRMKLFEHTQQMPLAFFMRTQTGALVSRLNNDVNGARAAFTDIVSNVFGNLVTVAFIVGALFVLSWRITLLVLILPPLLVWPTRYFGRKLQAITREQFGIMAAINNFMVEKFNVAGAQLAKLYGRRQDESKTFQSKASRLSDIDIKTAVYGRLFFAALALMASLGTALAYGWGGMLAVKKVLDIGTVVAIVSYLTRLYGPLVGLSNMQITAMTALVSFERIFELLDLPPMIKEKASAVALPPGPAVVAFDDVSFRYPAASEVSIASLEPAPMRENTLEKTVLRDITFRAEPGEVVALVGPSGAGKTTITQLLARLYDVQSGSITIDGIDVRDAKIDSVYQRIGVVTQDVHLFHDTIRANLLYAKPNATEAEITEALRAAEILPVIKSLPQGLDTLVGERGYRFSGGEKQRLAIARLLLKAPDIVILDEATAHLDSESEAAIQKALETLLAGRTSIVIAHRLSTVLKADQILVVQDGRIVQRGTHSKLVQLPGLYAELYERQFSVATVCA